MNVFLAGATGAIGRPCVRILVARGHRVFATTREPASNAELWQAGAIPVVVDVFDAALLALAVKATRPDAVLDQLTDLAMLHDPNRMAEALERNAHLRKLGTAHLVAAAEAAGAEHFVAQSIAWAYSPGSEPHDEDTALELDARGARGVTIAGVAALERSVLDNPRLRGCVLRYGYLYGPRTGNEDSSGLDMPLHVEAAAWAAVLAVEQHAIGAYNVAEPNEQVRTDKIRRDLHWDDSRRA